MIKKIILTLFIWNALIFPIESKLPEIDPPKVLKKTQEIIKGHASYTQLTPEIIQRIILNYIEELDPNKTYFIEADLNPWINPSPEFLETTLKAFNQANFTIFYTIHAQMLKAIERKKLLDEKISLSDLPENIDPKEFKDMEWTQSEEELLTRLKRIKALQVEAASKLDEELQGKSLQRLQKYQEKKKRRSQTRMKSTKNASFSP